jgi:lysozyme
MVRIPKPGLLVAALLVAALLLLPVSGCAVGGEDPAGSTADTTVLQTDGVADGATAGLETAAASATPPAAAGEEPEHLGIDVSHYSGEVDWAQVAGAGYSFAFVKATEGEDATDPLFADHWQELAGTGLARGAYHFYVAHDDPEVQARFYLDTVPFHESDLLPVVDVESPTGAPPPDDFASQLRTFLEIVEQETGGRPIIYTGPQFWQTHLAGDFSEYPLWIAEYQVAEAAVPAGFETWTLWQWEGDATIPGVEKEADVSRLAPGLGLDALRMPTAAP